MRTLPVGPKGMEREETGRALKAAKKGLPEKAIRKR
jgi:hypothetical protein